MGKIGINAPFLDGALTRQIEDTAESVGFETIYFTSNEEAEQKVDGCEIMFGNFTPEAVRINHTLKWLACSFAGVDMFLNDELYRNPDVLVTNSAGAYGVTISEHMICVTLMMMRRIPEYTKLTAKRGWGIIGEIDSIMNSTITVVGMGDIGTNYARRVKAMGAACVRGVRRTKKPGNPAFDEVYTTDELHKAVSGADVVALCVPGTDETAGIINESILSAMKDGSYLINVGRGSAVDQPALIKALQLGKLGGAALDVVYPEPLPKDDPLWDAPNLLLTPHVSGNMTLDITRERVVNMFCENLLRYKKGEKLNHLVDRQAGY